MRRFLSIAICLSAAVGFLSARSGMPAPDGEEGEKKLIDLKSDLMGPVAPGDTAIFLVGNFAAQHNGAVITCDSAVRYSDTRIEFFGNVLINKNTTYIYGDRAEYDGDRNEARVYSDIVKVIDGDATLYTYEFLFNTKENIGEFGGGGVLTNRDNLLESVRGYYYADTKELIAVERVEMRNDEYELTGDSVVYNMATDNAFFYDRTNIWNRDGDYLYADRGAYEKADTLYIVTRNGYLLTDKQEMWSDSIDFYRMRNHVILRRDIQLDDTEHKVLAFGEYGEYWKEPGNALLTDRPSAISYDRSQGDSLFMRADTMYLFTINEAAERRAAERRAAEQARADSLAALGLQADAEHVPTAAADGNRPVSAGNDAETASDGPAPGTVLSEASDLPVPETDSLGGEVPADSLLTQYPAGSDSLAVPAIDPLDTLVGDARKAYLKEQERKARAAAKAAKEKARKAELDEIAERRQQKATAKLMAQKEREEKRLEARRLKAESKLRARQARAARKGKTVPVDSTALQEIDSLLEKNAVEQDSLIRLATDSLTADSLSLLTADSLDVEQPEAPRDSIYRLLKGYRDVRIYRSDFQSVCDSMTSISTDSTIHLYINPVLWNQSNQVTSDVMDIYTERQQLARAEFVGSPMMVAQLDTTHYNQVAGKEMTSYFRNNEIYRNDVNGNAQTIYYMQDGEPPQITDVGFIESGDCSFYIEGKQVVTIVYRQDPVWNLYPIDKLPADQELFLKGFRWEGARRPSQRDVFDRRIRPTLRAEKSALPHPSFPLREALEQRKKSLSEAGRWSDRTDQVDAATVEWMRSLGYEVGQPRESGPAL